MEEIIKLNRKEKKQYFAYLGILFFVVSLMLMWIIFRKAPSPFYTTNTLDEELLARNNYFLMRQKEVLPLCDSVFSKITALKNMPSTVFIETDIKNDINAVNNFDESIIPSKDPRLVAFHQMALFQKLYFEDVLILKKKLQNIDNFKAQLDKCEIGYKNNQGLINQLNAADRAKGK